MESTKIKANTIKHWFTKWGLWILLSIALVIFVITRFIPATKNKDAIIQKAKDEAKRLKDEVSKELIKHNAEMDARKTELDGIKALEDEKTRLARLADFANRRRSG
jgi:Sec-independent protein translocase protein TatA